EHVADHHRGRTAHRRGAGGPREVLQAGEAPRRRGAPHEDGANLRGRASGSECRARRGLRRGYRPGEG
ncbi:MAG: Cytidine deaminase, partial [uncultured Thermomicrobiales bacterium]